MFKHTSHSSNFILFRENVLEPSDLLQSGLAAALRICCPVCSTRAEDSLHRPSGEFRQALCPALECSPFSVPVRRSAPGSRVSSVLGVCQTLCPALECSLSLVSVRRSALLSSVLCPQCLSDALPLVLECSLSSFCGACPPGDSENGCTGIHLFDFACLKVAVFYPHT